MEQLRDALSRTRSAGAIRLDGRLGEPLDPNVILAPLVARIEAMRQARPLDGGSLPEGIDLDALWHRWLKVQPSLAAFTRRELRALCWDARTAGDPTFLRELEVQGIIPDRTPFLRGLWHAHQAHWRLDTATRIESLIREGRRIRTNAPRWIEQVCDSPGVLTEDAPHAIAEEVIASLPATEEKLRSFGVTVEGSLGHEALNGARQLWLRRLTGDPKGAFAPALLRFGCDGMLAPALINLDVLRECCEHLLRLIAAGSIEYRNALRQFITSDQRLGHPRRVATRGNWIGFAEEAKSAAVQLFAARDLGTFFDILIGKSGDTQQRRAFWERYVDSPQLVDFAIACDEGDRARLKAYWPDGKPTVARLTGAPWQYSAFVMRFRAQPEDIVIAEMSKANNAMYQFTASVFEDQVGSLEQDRMSFLRLKNRNIASDWHTHRVGWHGSFASHLKRFGIQPG